MKNLLLFISFLILATSTWAQNQGSITFQWKKNLQDLDQTSNKVDLPFFDGIFYENVNSIPCKVITSTFSSEVLKAKIILKSEVFESLTEKDQEFINRLKISINPKIRKTQSKSSNEHILNYHIPVFVFDPFSLSWKKRKSFQYKIEYVLSQKNSSQNFRSGSTSPMNEGKWYKIGVTSTGIQKLNKSFFSNNNINISGVNPKNIRVFGYPEGMLPENIGNSIPNSLTEIASFFEGESDNEFNDNDYLLFFAKAANGWEFNSTNKTYKHEKHLYSDTAYYLINTGSIPALRIATSPIITAPANISSSSYDFHAFHEEDLTNLIKTGKDWFGEYFDNKLKQNFQFSIPERSTGEKVHFETSMAIRSTLAPNNNVYFRANGINVHNRLNISNVNTSYTSNYAVIINDADSFDLSNNTLDFQIEYEQPVNGAVAWLDFIEIKAKCKLNFNNTSFIFSDVSTIGAGNITEFSLSNTTSSTQIWDITNPYSPLEINKLFSSNISSFKSNTDSLKTFIAFNSNITKTPFYSTSVNNQNLTGLTDIDYIILTPKEFVSQSNKLANFHQQHSGLTTAVVELNQVYNEFSGGTPDIAAIRNFCKYLYDNASSTSTQLKYLLLMGDGSYDPKYRKFNNVDFIPTFQSNSSISPTASFTSDDYFGMLDDANGIYSAGSAVDIGIGRFPARNSSDATGFVNKVIHYANCQTTQIVSPSSNIQTKKTYNDWKNKMLFVADDGSNSDGYTSAHLSQTEMIINSLLDEDSTFNVNKVYLDAYVKESTAGGGRYPDVNREIKEAMSEGAFFVSYIGHGGEVGWADERVLTIENINAWNNIDGLPLFLTATCEFSRFDDPERTAAGELVILNPNGGAIAMLTTTRLVYGGLSNNIGFSINFFEKALNEYNGEMPRLGDVVRLTKGVSPLGSNYNNRKFALLGDPALKLAYPKYSVETTKINDVSILSNPDTLNALNKVKIEGRILDKNNNPVIMDGFIYPTVFDKLNNLTTLDNNNSGPTQNFQNRTSILYKGVASVKNGEFSFEFMVPKDINYSYGKGRISYYFANDTIDGKGYNEKITVGGSSTNPTNDNEGPEVQLYMNDTNFIFGGTTTSSPLLYAIVKDQSGINTTGTSLGHDITAVLDEDYSNSIIMNDYYSSNLDDFTQGTISYPYSDLSNGKHTLRLKLWDVNNNSTEAYTEFIVANSSSVALNNVLNYPNPFTTSTNFYFEHNQPNETLDVLIKILTISGKQIKAISTTINTNGNLKTSPINWDGKDEFGGQIGRGVYLYQIEVRTPDGKTATKLEKLVILK